MDKEIIIKKGTEHAAENWQIETSPNEFDNCKEDFINGALWVVKNLALSSVSKCADEVIKYIENDAEIAMPVNELMHEDGRHLSKKEYGHVLLKYLIVELRERFC